jgi:molecular chaperone GrpE
MAEEIENQESDVELTDVDADVSDDRIRESDLGPEALGRQVQELIGERDDFKDRLLRKQAEFENFKKRTDRERADFVKFASAELMREVLNVLDSFELALTENRPGDGETRGVHEGFELIYKQLMDSMKRFGLEHIEAKGQAFDPNIHQAVSTQSTDEVAEGTVLEELRRGYRLNGKLLRPVMVIVAAPTDNGSGGEGSA